jgi:hypothetical protein
LPSGRSSGVAMDQSSVVRPLISLRGLSRQV